MGDTENPIEPPDTHATPLQPVSPDRVNHQNPSMTAVLNNAQRDSDVHDKIRQFNNLSHLPSGASSMSKQLERMTSDAALKRAMIGREEAETEMRRYREEARSLRKQVEEGRERERRVGERLETVMESYGRAKETYSHTQTIWEKEIRRARKETFKSQSSIVKLQEELKAARVALKSAEECLEREKDLSKAREQEAFAGRYQLAALQEELEKAQERTRFLEEERDAFKAAARSEEVARIAAEGRLPLPPEDPTSEFASPKKSVGGRESLSAFEILSSASTEAEVEELTRLWQWEKQRADRTQDHLEFVQAEFELFSSRRKSNMRRSIAGTPRKERTGPIEIVDPSDLVILGKDFERRKSSPRTKAKAQKPEQASQAQRKEASMFQSQGSEAPIEDAQEAPKDSSSRRESRPSTIFVPSEGIFRTVSQQELDAMEQDNETTTRPPSPENPQPGSRRYARTPSAEPPSFALMVAERTSLLSLLNAPRESDAHIGFEIPTRTGDDSQCGTDEEGNENENENESPETEATNTSPSSNARPQTSAAFYTVTTTTTVPMKDETATSPRQEDQQDQDQEQQQQQQRPRSQSRTPSFDVNNPALIPTMTREEALAQIRERRGRARSAMQGAMTPRKQTGAGAGDRNVSAPAGTANGGGSS
ncbi:hypothetical protein F4861DRAFT_495650 [Xylaria intraflava]|nr:hypothetical protein F4861DRAFT_495650 [Xylaria intraflava]